jgi:hypothetical protein
MRFLRPAAVTLVAAAAARPQDCPPTFLFTGDEVDEVLGQFSSELGDLDGDGIVELGIASRSYHSDTGEVLVYSGATGTLLRTLVGEGTQNGFGQGLAGLGDVDGDGHDDFLITAPFIALPKGSGRAYVYSGADWSVLRTIDMNDGDGHLGQSACRLSDLDADGVADFALGAPATRTPFGGDSGRIYLYSGATGAWLRSIDGDGTGHGLGWTIADAGDLDDDGIGDLIAAAVPFDFGRGRVATYSGADGSQFFSRDGVAQGGALGTSVGGADDVDGDGERDVFASEPSVNGTDTVYFLDGDSGGIVATVTSSGENGLGTIVRRLGDVTGDGVGDFAFANPGLDTKVGTNAGQVDIYSGATWTVARTLSAEKSNDGFGSSLAAIADLNGDGLTDLLIGARGSDAGGSDAGRAYMFLTSTASWNNFGEGLDGTFGIPALIADHAPHLGKSVTVTASNSAGVDTCAVLVVGATRAEIPAWGGTILVVLDLVVPLLLPAAGGAVDYAVPNDPAICGQTWDLQVLQLDAGAVRDISFSEGLELVLGV